MILLIFLILIEWIPSYDVPVASLSSANLEKQIVPWKSSWIKKKGLMRLATIFEIIL